MASSKKATSVPKKAPAILKGAGEQTKLSASGVLEL